MLIGFTAPAQTAEESFNKGIESYKAGDYTSAVKYFQQAAEQGHAKAQGCLGDCYGNGLGVAQSYAEAVKWYRKAAEQGLAIAQYNLGVYYTFGIGVAKNYTESVKWYRKAAEQGYANAIKALKRLGER